MASRDAAERHGLMLLLVAAGVVLFWPLPYIGAIHPPNELTRVYQTRAIVDDGVLYVDGQIRRFGPLFDLAYAGGHHYPNKAPGVSLLGVPVYAAYRALVGREPSLKETVLVLEKVLLGVPTLLLLGLLWRSCRRAVPSPWARFAALVAYTFGSTALPYALLLYGHQLAAALLFSGFVAYRRGVEGDAAGFIALGGLSQGVALLVEYTVAPAVLLTALYAVLSGRPGLRRAAARAGAGLAGALIPVGALLLYHQAAFGSPFATGYDFVESPALRAIHKQGWLGVHLPRIGWLAQSLFSGRGLLTLMPWVGVALVGGLCWVLRGRVRGALGASPSAPVGSARPSGSWVELAVAGLYVLFAASWDPGVWGWVAGPRHLVP
ncbi:MAG: hypothetical protein D6729_01115, partial [Deltaproteobacteria bacterium]